MLLRSEQGRVAEEIVRHLLRSIFDRTLRPGERLPSERSLASRLGVNRASLREALKHLERLGLVHTRQGDGTRVLDFMGHAGLELLEHLIPIALGDGRALVHDLLEVREILGREVARLAARRCQPEDLAELRRIHREAERRATRPRELLLADVEFYTGLGRATHNRVVQLLTNSIRAAVARAPEVFERLMPGPEVTLFHQRGILEALAARDPAAAASLAEGYLGRMCDALDPPATA